MAIAAGGTLEMHVATDGTVQAVGGEMDISAGGTVRFVGSPSALRAGCHTLLTRVSAGNAANWSVAPDGMKHGRQVRLSVENGTLVAKVTLRGFMILFN